MMKHEVRAPGQALDYITDCCLATVCDMAMKKSRPKGEFARQISIAQTAINWMIDFEIRPTSRAHEVINEFKGDVGAWSDKFKPSQG